MSGPWTRFAASEAQEAEATPGPWAAYGDPAAADQKGPPPMATATATTRKGRKVTFMHPMDADEAAIRKLAAAATGEPRYARAQVLRAQTAEGAPVATEQVRADPDDTSALSGFVAGALKPIDNVAKWVGNTRAGEALDEFGQSLGFPSIEDTNAEHDEWRRNNTRTGYQMLGSIASTLPASRLPGGLAVQGGASGALLSDADTLGDTAKDAAFGAAGGVVGGKVLQSLGGLASGVTNAGARALNKAGVPLTLGQIGQAAGNLPGRVVGYVEDVAAGLPLVGSVVTAARNRGLEGFNVAAGNRILANIGEALPKGAKPGHDMIDAVQSKLSGRYQQLVPNLTATADQQFAADLAAARDLADQASRAPQLAKIVNSVFGNRVNGSQLSGQALKDAESELTRLYGKYANSQGDEGLYGEAIDGVRQALRDMVARSNPAQASELGALNTGWAQLKALRGAVRSGSDKAKATGVTSPGALLRQSAGKGYRDPFAEAATDILPNRTPDSGTAGRLFTGAALAGSIGVDPREHPFLAGTLGTVGALNSRTGQVALNKLAFGARPAGLTALTQPLNRLSRYAPQAVTPLLVQPRE